MGKRNYFPKYPVTKPHTDSRRNFRRKKTDCNGSRHHQNRHEQHLSSRRQEISCLNGIQVQSQSLIFRPNKHDCHLRCHCIAQFFLRITLMVKRYDRFPHYLIQRCDRFRRFRFQLVISILVLLIILTNQHILGRQKADTVKCLLPHDFRNCILNAALLDSHIHDIRCIRRQGQVTICLQNQKKNYGNYRCLKFSEIFHDFKHMPTPSF